MGDVEKIVVAIQGNPIKREILGSGQDGYVLTWNSTNGEWEAKSLPPISFYGIEYTNFADTVSFPGSGAFVQIPFNGTPGPSNGVSYSSNNIVVANTGVVRVTGMVSMYLNADAQDTCQLAIYKNGSMVGVFEASTMTAGLGDVMEIVVDVIASCSPGDAFGLYMATGSVITGAINGGSLLLHSV
jgi:hypothetical protein